MHKILSVVKSFAVIAALVLGDPANAAEYIEAKEYKLHCNQGPGVVFAVLEYKGSFLGFDRMGHVSIAQSKRDRPEIVGVWSIATDTNDIVVTVNEKHLFVKGLNSKKCDSHFTFN